MDVAETRISINKLQLNKPMLEWQHQEIGIGIMSESGVNYIYWTHMAGRTDVILRSVAC